MQPSFIMPPPQFSGRWDEGMTTVGRPSSMYAALRPAGPSVATSPRSPRKLQPLAEAGKRPIPPTPLEHFWNEHTLRNNARNLTRWWSTRWRCRLCRRATPPSCRRAARTTSKSPRGPSTRRPTAAQEAHLDGRDVDATTMRHTTSTPRRLPRPTRGAPGRRRRPSDVQNHDMDMTKLSARASTSSGSGTRRRSSRSTGVGTRRARTSSTAWSRRQRQPGLTEALKQHVFTHFEDLASAFAYVDKDRSSRISPQELENALRRLGLPIPDRRLKQLVAACDRTTTARSPTTSSSTPYLRQDGDRIHRQEEARRPRACRREEHAREAHEEPDEARHVRPRQ